MLRYCFGDYRVGISYLDVAAPGSFSPAPGQRMESQDSPSPSRYICIMGFRKKSYLIFHNYLSMFLGGVFGSKRYQNSMVGRDPIESLVRMGVILLCDGHDPFVRWA